MDSKSISTILMLIMGLLVITAIVLDSLAFNRARNSESITGYAIGAAAVTSIAVLLLIIGAFLGSYGFLSIAPLMLFAAGILLIVSVILDVVGLNRAQKGDRKDAATSVLFAAIFATIAIVLIIIAVIVHATTSAAEEVAESPEGQNLLNTLAANPELLLV